MNFVYYFKFNFSKFKPNCEYFIYYYVCKFEIVYSLLIYVLWFNSIGSTYDISYHQCNDLDLLWKLDD